MKTQSQSDGILHWLRTNSPVLWTVALLAAFALLFKLRKGKHPQAPVKNATPNLLFEFGDTEKSKAFITRNPQFPLALAGLFATANRCFGRDPRPKNQLEDICFWLGHTCRQDFVEVVFLAVNGYGAGATKIIRSLYERAVTIAYLIQNPDKVGDSSSSLHELANPT